MNTKPKSLFFHGVILYCSFPLSKNKLCEGSDKLSYLKLRGDSFGVLDILAISQACKVTPSGFEYLCPTSPSSDTSKILAVAQMLNEYSC